MIDKKTLIIILFTIGIVILIIIITLFKSSTPPSNQNPPTTSSGNYPQLDINSSQAQIDTGKSVNNQTQKLLGYQIQYPTDTEEKARSVATKLGFQGQEREKNKQTQLSISKIGDQTIYTWANPDAGRSISYNLKTGTFEFSSNPSKKEGKLDTERAKTTVENFLKELSLLPPNSDFAVSLVDNNIQPATVQNFNYYHITVTPKLGNLPLISYKGQGDIISFYLDKEFSFYLVDYLYVPLQTNNQTLSLRPLKEVLNPDLLKQTKPTFLNLNNFQSEQGLDGLEINQITVSQTNLVYYLDLLNSFQVYPSYQITANIKTKDNLTGIAVYLIKATE